MEVEGEGEAEASGVEATDLVEEVYGPGVTHSAMQDMMGDDMGEEGEEELEKSDSVTGMSAADKKKHRLEYLQLLKEIEGQNHIVDQLKDQLMRMCESSCLTKCELKEIKKLRGCMENENLKLQCMVQKAIQMQNECPSKCWDEVPIVTTLDDDVFPRMGNAGVLMSLGLLPQPVDDKKKDICDVCAKKRKKKRICRTGDEESLDSDTYRLFEEMAMKDKLIECLNDKMSVLQQGLDGKKGRDTERQRAEKPCKSKQEDTIPRLEDTIADMQATVDNLKEDLKSLCKEKQAYDKEKARKQASMLESGSKKQNELRKLKEDYAALLVNYAKKDEQLKEMEGRAKGYCGGGGAGGKSEGVDYVELKMLREKVSDLRDEQEEYTCIIKEQAEQLDEYRKKYIDAQQKVEEQKCMLEKIDMNNKRIEGQIEAEVKRIKAKFKEQLSELSQYPKLLENEQIKLASACKDREELEGKLRLVCKELKQLKEHMVKEEKPDCSQKLAKAEHELFLLQNKLEELQKDKEIVCEELLRAKVDLDTMRAESAKIITSTKERFEMTKSSMCTRIDILEKELAQCRANAYLSISDREAVIKEMQSQLSTLSYSFDSAQKQIKTLKNHISFLSNDQCIPIKC